MHDTPQSNNPANTPGGGQPAAPRRRTGWPYWAAGGVLLVALCCGIAAVADQAGRAASTTSQGPTAPAAASQQDRQPAASAISPTAVPTHAAQWTTVQRFSGTTSQQTPTFTVPDEWRIVWTCKKAGDYGGNFVVTLYGADGSVTDLPVNAMDDDGATTYEHQGGQVYLAVDAYSEQWTIEVQVQQ